MTRDLVFGYCSHTRSRVMTDLISSFELSSLSSSASPLFDPPIPKWRCHCLHPGDTGSPSNSSDAARHLNNSELDFPSLFAASVGDE